MSILSLSIFYVIFVSVVSFFIGLGQPEIIVDLTKYFWFFHVSLTKVYSFRSLPHWYLPYTSNISIKKGTTSGGRNKLSSSCLRALSNYSICNWIPLALGCRNLCQWPEQIAWSFPFILYLFFCQRSFQMRFLRNKTYPSTTSIDPKVTGGHWWSFSNGARANFRIVLDPPEIVLIDMTLNVVQDTIVFSDGQVFDNDFYFDHRTTQRLI